MAIWRISNLTVLLTYGAKEHDQTRTQTQNTFFTPAQLNLTPCPVEEAWQKAAIWQKQNSTCTWVSHPLDQSGSIDCYCSVNPVIIPTNMTPLTQTAKRQQHKPLHNRFQSGCCCCLGCEWSKHIEEGLLWIMIQYFPSLTEMSLTMREKCEACLLLCRCEQWGQTNAEFGPLKW